MDFNKQSWGRPVVAPWVLPGQGDNAYRERKYIQRPSSNNGDNNTSKSHPAPPLEVGSTQTLSFDLHADIPSRSTLDIYLNKNHSPDLLNIPAQPTTQYSPSYSPVSISRNAHRRPDTSSSSSGNDKTDDASMMNGPNLLPFTTESSTISQYSSTYLDESHVPEDTGVYIYPQAYENSSRLTNDTLDLGHYLTQDALSDDPFEGHSTNFEYRHKTEHIPDQQAAVSEQSSEKMVHLLRDSKPAPLYRYSTELNQEYPTYPAEILSLKSSIFSDPQSAAQLRSNKPQRIQPSRKKAPTAPMSAREGHFSVTPQNSNRYDDNYLTGPDNLVNLRTHIAGPSQPQDRISITPASHNEDDFTNVPVVQAISHDPDLIRVEFFKFLTDKANEELLRGLPAGLQTFRVTFQNSVGLRPDDTTAENIFNQFRSHIGSKSNRKDRDKRAKNPSHKCACPMALCQGRFTRASGLKNHLGAHFRLAVKMCPVCDKRMPNSSYKRHVDGHSKSKKPPNSPLGFT